MQCLQGSLCLPHIFASIERQGGRFKQSVGKNRASTESPIHIISGCIYSSHQIIGNTGGKDPMLPFLKVLRRAYCRSKTPREGPSHAAINLILEILCFCTSHHGVRMKYFVLQNEMIEKVLRLLHRPERWLVVAAIRFVRACLAPKDEFYNRHIVSFFMTSLGVQEDLDRRPICLSYAWIAAELFLEILSLSN